MMKYISHIVLEDHRPFSYRDFLRFEVDGKEYRMQHGTFRNKISQLMHAEKVELAYNSVVAFYTLKGIIFGKPKITMTPDRTGVQDPILKLIQNLPMDKRALHDIRLRFQVPGIWSILSAGTTTANSEGLQIDPVSKDIRLKACEIEDLLIRTTIHRTDTITVIVACSWAPVAIDISGIIRLSNALTRVEERLSKIVYDCLSVSSGNSSNGRSMYQQEHHDTTTIIPSHNNWIVTLWHFGTDSLIRYAGEKFEVTWEAAENVLVRVYTKNLKEKGTRIRLERQEYPNKTFAEAVGEKLNAHC
jgi:hypothetical protein